MNDCPGTNAPENPFPKFLFLLVLSMPAQTAAQTTIPMAGNTFFSNHEEFGLTLSDQGIGQWTDTDIEATAYVRFLKPGDYSFSMKARTSKANIVRVTLANKDAHVKINRSEWKQYAVGKFNVRDTGYVAIELHISKTDSPVDIESLEINCPADDLQFVKDDFYWGRRGPSVHLTYTMPEGKKIQWFYNEVTIPPGMDEIGSYYMSNGFKEGYFGIQVNSETERRILFSVWSPYKTDDPNSIPDSAKVRLLGKGTEVYAGEFGNEGSGGQSYLKYPWRAGVTYSFLTGITPDGKGSTTYTSYFLDPAAKRWILIASFLRPQTNSWYERPHSFLENFVPERGASIRKGFYGNQWACDTDGQWTELTSAKFTHDATARKKARMDFAGGADGNRFFLMNCGFFSAYTRLNSIFERTPTGRKPAIDLKELPKE